MYDRLTLIRNLPGKDGGAWLNGWAGEYVDEMVNGQMCRPVNRWTDGWIDA